MESVYLTPEHELLRDQVARFVAREVEPHAAGLGRGGHTPREVLRKLGAAGLLGLMYESEHGGGDADALTNLVFAEALSQSTFGGFIITVLVHTDMASPHLHHAGSAAQKARYMPGVTAGTTITAVAITEPGAGSDVAGIRTTATRSADGSEWILNGTKLFITNGVLADLYFVAAKHRRGPARDVDVHRREGDAGLSRRPRARQDRLALVRHRRAGVRGLPHPRRQPARRGEPRLLLGDEELPDRAHRARRRWRSATACRRFALTLEHVRDRQAFGAALFDKQVVRQRLAMLDAKVRAARAFMYHCAWRVTQGHDVVQEVSMLKALTGELVNEVVQAASSSTAAWATCAARRSRFETKAVFGFPPSSRPFIAPSTMGDVLLDDAWPPLRFSVRGARECCRTSSVRTISPT